MSILPFIAALPFLLIGFHLLRVAFRSGATPDRLLSAFFLLIGFGTVPRMIGIDLATSGAPNSSLVFWLNTSANLAIGTGLAFLAAFTWKVFRPETAWAKQLAAVFAVGFMAACAVGVSSIEANRASSPTAIAFNFLGAGALGWAFLECVLYYRQMRKRCALGITDPVVANRFLLWSVWTGSIALLAIVLTVLRVAVWGSGAGDLIASGVDPGGSWLAVIGAAKGLVLVIAPVAVVAVYLSFSPPAAYLRWLRSRQPEPSQT